VLESSAAKTITFWKIGIVFYFLYFHVPHNASSYMVFSSLFVLTDCLKIERPSFALGLGSMWGKGAKAR